MLRYKLGKNTEIKTLISPGNIASIRYVRYHQSPYYVNTE